MGLRPFRIENWKREPGFQHQIEHIETLLSSEAFSLPDELDLPAFIREYLEVKKIRLFSHQQSCLEAIRQQKSVIITTSTASGKTLGYMIPILERAMQHPEETTLLLFPLKALANDQWKQIKEMQELMKINVPAFIYDGDTPLSQRSMIRSKARIILTNPYELHYILPWHAKWARFYSHLGVVVIDEAHTYRGVFGSNFSLLVRRLKRICHFYQSKPVFVLSSATMQNAQEFSKKLIDESCQLIDQDGSSKGTKHFVFYNPFKNGQDTRTTLDESRKIFHYCISHELQTLCFVGSRKSTEWILFQLKQKKNPFNQPLLDRISSYRAGYLPEERRRIEQQLKSRELLGAISTNALEVGIDIGSLDSVIITGYPGSVISTWQQAGRCGRGKNESFVFLVAYQNPLDQYIMKHPIEFLNRNHEHAIINPHNPYILANHLLCAAYEMPVDPEKDSVFFGLDTTPWWLFFEQEGLVTKTALGYTYIGRDPAVKLVSLQNLTNEPFRLFCGNTLLETLDKGQVFREAHEGAIFLHFAEPYRVISVDWITKKIEVAREETDHSTEVMKEISVQVLHKRESQSWRALALQFGEINVKEHYFAYQEKRYQQVLSQHEMNLPPMEFDTESMWMEIPDEIIYTLQKKHTIEDIMGGLHGTEHAMIGIMPFYVMCDRRDIGGFSTMQYLPTGKPTIFIYDGYEGGIGLSEEAYRNFEAIIEATYEVVKTCPCDSDNGCPACIQSPKCGNENAFLNKAVTIELLEWMMRLPASIKKESHARKKRK